MPWSRKKRWIAAALVGAVAIVIGALSLLRPFNIANDQYAVYSAYLESGLTGESHRLGDHRRTVVIAADSTMVADVTELQRLRYTVRSYFNLRRRIDPPSVLLTLRLVLANVVTHQLDRKFTISAPYQFAGKKLLSWEKFQEQFPGSYGYVSLSSVAFSSDRKTALFYTEHMCGLCGGGEYVMMRKTGSTWVEVNSWRTWVS